MKTKHFSSDSGRWRQNLSGEWVNNGESDKIKHCEKDPGKCIHLYDKTQGNTNAFDRKLSSSGVRRKILKKKKKKKEKEAK